LLRIVVSFFILFSTFAFKFSEIVSVLAALIGTNVLVTLLSAFFIARWHDNRYFIWFQVLWDVLFVTSLVYASGGTQSLFTFMYILSVINSSILLSRAGTLICASLYYSGFLIIEIGERLNLWDPADLNGIAVAEVLPLPELVNKILLNGAAIMVAAWLSSKVTDQAKSINSKLRQKQKDLEEVKALNEHMVQSIQIGLLSLSPNETIIFSNQSAGKILNQSPKSYIGKNIHTLFSQIDLKQEQSRFPSDVSYGTGETARHLSLAQSVLTNERDQNIGWIVSFQDVTDIRRMEEDVKRGEKFAAVGKLAAGIAHEIRNPLASMSGSIQLLKTELDLEPVNQHLMNIVIRETDRLNTLITDFLIFARPGKMEIELVDVTALLNETLGILENDPQSRKTVKIERNLHESLFVNADSDQLRQLFWNLFKNAIQAMPNGGSLVVSAMPNISFRFNGKGALVKVSDTGEGMDEETANNIFDPFYTTKEMGTGLGLTTAYRIVENHQGRIWCESRQGEGTSFFILLPSA
jgi:two-component system sensor histidine kinase PilS (NtrC family)